jgi:hypothetical protein
MASKFCDSLSRIGCLRDQKHALLRSDDRAETSAKNGMVFDRQDTDRAGRAHRQFLLREILTMFAAPAKGWSWSADQPLNPSDTSKV